MIPVCASDKKMKNQPADVHFRVTMTDKRVNDVGLHLIFW